MDELTESQAEETMNDTSLTPVSSQPDPSIGAFDPEDVLIEYDAPLVFTFHDALGRVAVAYLADAQTGHTVYLAANVSDGLLAEIKSGTAPVRAAFRDRVWVVVVREGGVIVKVVEELAAAVTPKYLPHESLSVYTAR